MKQTIPSVSLVPDERIASKVLLVRGIKVVLDGDRADLYGVKTNGLNQAVSRNNNRFPRDFMFRLSSAEFNNLNSQIATSKRGG